MNSFRAVCRINPLSSVQLQGWIKFYLLIHSRFTNIKKDKNYNRSQITFQSSDSFNEVLMFIQWGMTVEALRATINKRIFVFCVQILYTFCTEFCVLCTDFCVLCTDFCVVCTDFVWIFVFCIQILYGFLCSIYKFCTDFCVLCKDFVWIFVFYVWILYRFLCSMYGFCTDFCVLCTDLYRISFLRKTDF